MQNHLSWGQPTHVTRHCAKPMHRPLRVEYHTSRAAHRLCAVVSGWVGELGRDIKETNIGYEIDSALRRKYKGKLLKTLEIREGLKAIAVNEDQWRQAA